MAHYDSRELAPGASDDGYGVVTLLETARALAASPPLRHDVVMLVTEGEEPGLLGARVFFAENPVAKDVGLVLNFEARGDRGPAIMFQTSEHAGALVDVLARAAPRVVASSLSQEVYRRMPNDTDLTVALQAGYPAMNFANIDGFARYHRATDTVANASASTLQHHGSYALALARAFGDAEPMVPPARADQVYFDLGPVFVHYSDRAALPLAAAALVLLAGALVWNVRRGRARIPGVGLGVAAALAAPIAAAVLSWAIGWIATRARGEVLQQPELRDTIRLLYDAAFALLGAGVACAVVAAAVRRARCIELASGAMLVWAALAVVAAAIVPGVSCLFVWPALAAAIVALLPFDNEHPAAMAANTVVAALALMLWVPVARQLDVVFGPPIAPAVATIAALATTAAIPLVELVVRPRPRLAPAALLASAAAGIALAFVLPPFDPTSPRPDSLLYAVDADHETASWLSTDDAPDAWTTKALAGARAATAPELFPRSTRELLRASAPLVAVGRPAVNVVSDARDGGTRTLRLRVRPPAGAEVLSLSVPPDAHVASASVQGRPFSVEPEDGWLDLAYFGPPPEGLDVVLTTPASDPVALRVVAQIRGLPPGLGSLLGPRPADLMPAVGWSTFRSSDMTLVDASFRW
jgi:hypothetical protein